MRQRRRPQRAITLPVAVKVVFRDRLNKLFTQDRFRQEAEVVANLLHPNVVTIFEIDAMRNIVRAVTGWLAAPSITRCPSWCW